MPDGPYLKFAFVGKNVVPKSVAAAYLYKKKNFKRMRCDDAVTRLLRLMGALDKHRRMKREQRVRLYSALYNVDKNLQIDYLLRRVAISKNHIVVDDARYVDEVNKLKAAGFVIIRIVPGEYRNPRLTSLLEGSGTVLLQEYYGREEAYPVDYSITHDTTEAVHRSLDRIVDKELQKLLS